MSPKRLLARLIAAAFIGIMMAGPGAAVFPSTLRWGAWATCSGETSAAPERFRASYSRPGESQVRPLCSGPDGRAEDHTGMAIAGLWTRSRIRRIRIEEGGKNGDRIESTTCAASRNLRRTLTGDKTLFWNRPRALRSGFQQIEGRAEFVAATVRAALSAPVARRRTPSPAA